MSYKSFTNWCIKEGKDIFGFEKKRLWVQDGMEDDKPVKDVNVQVVVEYLSHMALENKQAKIKWENELVWGESTGSVQLSFSPLGSFKAMIRKKSVDLQGNPFWVCKDCYNLTYTKSETDESLSQKLFDRVMKIDALPPDSANPHFDQLESLALALGGRVKRDNPEIFIFEGIRKVDDNNFLIYSSLRGGGVEAPGASRVEEFVIDLSYNKDKGLIKIFGHDVQSPTKGHVWLPQPSEWEEYYTPSQPREEIIKTTIDILSTY